MRESAASVLARCLDAVQEGRQARAECLARYPERSDELRPLIEMVELLSDAPEVTLRPIFRETARHRLLARLPERRPVSAGRFMSAWDRLVARWHFGPVVLYRRRVAAALIALLALAGVLLGGGRVVSASEGALPGDALYPVKVAVEESRLALSDDERALGLYLVFTQARIDELERLSTAQRFENLSAATSRLEQQVQEATELVTVIGGQDAARSRVLLEQLDASWSAHRARLEQLLESAPDSARPSLERAIQSVEDEPEEKDEDRSIDDLDGSSGDADGGQERDRAGVESDGVGSDPEEPESPEALTPDDDSGDGGEGNSSAARQGSSAVDESGAPDGNSDSRREDGDDPVGSKDEAEDEAGDSPGSDTGSSGSSDDDSESESHDRSRSDGEDSDPSGGSSSHSQDDQSDEDPTPDGASGSDEASGSDDTAGSDQDRQDGSEHASDKDDGDR